MTSINSFYGFQTSPVILCMQNSVISIRITSLHWSQPTYVVFACKTATLASELQVSIGPSPHLCFCTFTTATFWRELIFSVGPRPHLWYFSFKTAILAPQLQVSMCPSPHLWFCAFKTATLGPELQVYKGPRPHLCFFCIQNSDFITRTASLYGSQPSSVVFERKTATFGSESHVSMGPTLRL